MTSVCRFRIDYNCRKLREEEAETRRGRGISGRRKRMKREREREERERGVDLLARSVL
jgi:hypothetical protein